MTSFQKTIVAALLVAGSLYRLWPVLAGTPYLETFFVTEDGYLMLTIARNMAIGLGMTVSDGTIATNGVQPLATFLFTLPYLSTGGDKTTSLVGIHLIQAGTALACVFAIRALAAKLLAPRDPSPIWPWAVALLWFLSPLLLRHSMNGLETSLYTLLIVVTLLFFVTVLQQSAGSGLRGRLILGFLCGLTVLGRNDAVFFVTALFTVWAIWSLTTDRSGLVGMIVKLVPPGLLSIATAAPWLLYNKLAFGAFMPISGTAQSLTAKFGQNLPLIPVKAFEYILPMLPIPGRLESHPTVIAATALLVTLSLGLFVLRQVRHGSRAGLALTAVYLLHFLALCGFYGLYFGAPHFVSRYLAPTAPLLITAGLGLALEIDRALRHRTTPLLSHSYAGAGIVLSIALLALALLPGRTRQGHEQVIRWVSAHVPEDAWVGAVQTGTLGYWHNRTINLDGKVNPDALAARAREGHVLNYVVDSPIDYLVDWAGIGDWPTFPQAAEGFSDAFETILRDDVTNLAALKRRGARN